MSRMSWTHSMRRFWRVKLYKRVIAVSTACCCQRQAEKLCGSVELGLGADSPLLVKYDLESGTPPEAV